MILLDYFLSDKQNNMLNVNRFPLERIDVSEAVGINHFLQAIDYFLNGRLSFKMPLEKARGEICSADFRKCNS